MTLGKEGIMAIRLNRDTMVKFERNVRVNYRKATSWDLLGPGLLMERGRLTKQGEILWALKVGKAYGRRGRYILNPVGYE